MGALSIFPKLPQQTRDELANRHLKKCFFKAKVEAMGTAVWQHKVCKI